MNPKPSVRRSLVTRGLVLPLLAGGVLGLAACGDDGTTAANAGAGTVTQGARGGEGGRPGGGPGFGGATAEERAELQACLKKQGVTLPARPTGAPGDDGAGGAPPAGADGSATRGGPGGGLPGATPGRGGGSTAEREKFQAALKACGASAPRRPGGAGGGAPDVDDPDYRASIEAYTACVRRNGFDLPDPDFSGDGPVFDPDRVDQSDATFRKASAACRSTLRPPRSGTGDRPRDDGAGSGGAGGAAATT